MVIRKSVILVSHTVLAIVCLPSTWMGEPGGTVSAEILLGSFTTRAHDLAGEVYAISDRILEARNFVYDGLGPAAFFWADKSATPSMSGMPLLDGAPSQSCGTEALPASSEDAAATFRFEFPEGQSLLDYVNGSISVWCRSASANFGEVVIDPSIDLSELNSTALGEGPNFECASLTLGTFVTRAHEFTGTLVALSDRVLEVRNMYYDGLGPAAYFWADTSTVPSFNGSRLNDGAPSGSCGTTPLPEASNATHRVEFPEGKSIYDYIGGSIGIWCEAAKANFGEVVIYANNTGLALLPKSADGGGPSLQCATLSLGNFTTRAHDLVGEVLALSDTVLEVRGMIYDGLGPAAYFWADTSANPTENGFRLLDAAPSSGCGTTPLPEARGVTQRFEFPEGKTIRDIVGGSISVWCESALANFGEVVIGSDLALDSLPSLEAGEGPALDCGSGGSGSGIETPAFTTTPDGFNCEELTEDFQVRWMIENDQVMIQLIGRIADDGYMAFGVSGSPDAALMLGADAVVADFYDGQPRARDFYMDQRAQCSVDTGVCADTNGGFTDDVVDGSVMGERSSGLTMVQYARPASPSNTADQMTGYVVDQALSVTPGTLTTVVWALGPIDPESGNPFFHSVGFSRNLIQFDFGRETADNCEPLISEEEEKNDIVPFVRPILKDSTEIRANIGPSGGDRGYVAISGGRTPWGIAWYLNKILIPVLELRRGTKYTFLVNGGNDIESSSEYHPFYLTSSIGGGYVQQSPEARLNETVYAGVEITNQTDDGVFGFKPTAVGPLCSYGETATSKNAAEGGFMAYFSTLNTSSCTQDVLDNAAKLEFTPDENTPDMIYYQCLTHTNLGWEIYVIDADAPSILDIDCSAFGSTPIQLTSELKLNAIIDTEENVLIAELEYSGNAWVGMAFTNGQPAMIGAEAVIGIPGQPNSATNPAKYNLNEKSLSGVVQMPAERQTLKNATITQEGGKTILRFTKLLVEAGEHPIFFDQTNTFLFAHGSSNSLGFHAGFGNFELLPNQCAVRLFGELQNEEFIDQQGSVAVEAPDLNRPLWMAHGACAATAWGILVPLAIGASLIRKVFEKLGFPGSTWFQIHRGLNTLAAILTICAFSLAVAAINKGSSDPDHFNKEVMHRRTGFVIFLLTMAQAINGILRPHAPESHPYQEEEEEGEVMKGDTENEETRNLDGDNEEDGADTKKKNDEEKGTLVEKKNSLRFGWEIFHRLLGFTLLGFTWWQVQDGLGLFAERFQEEPLDNVFWIVVGCLSGTIAVLAVYSRVAL